MYMLLCSQLCIFSHSSIPSIPSEGTSHGSEVIEGGEGNYICELSNQLSLCWNRLYQSFQVPLESSFILLPFNSSPKLLTQLY